MSTQTRGEVNEAFSSRTGGTEQTKLRHPSWCDLGGDCSLDAPNIVHRGRVSRIWPRYDDACIEVAFERPVDLDGSGVDEGRTVVRLTVTLTALDDGAGGPVVADVLLDQRDVEQLRYVLASYTKATETGPWAR